MTNRDVIAKMQRGKYLIQYKKQGGEQRKLLVSPLSNPLNAHADSVMVFDLLDSRPKRLKFDSIISIDKK